MQKREAANFKDEKISPIKLHPNCTQPPKSDQNVIENDAFVEKMVQ